MHELLSKRTVAECLFNRLTNIIESLLLDKTTIVPIIERRLNELGELWTTLQQSHDYYIIDCFTDASVIAQQDQWIELYSKTFYAIELKCLNYLNAINTASPIIKDNAIKIERFKFRIFNGNIRKYAKFKAEFLKFVSPQCTTNQIAFVLKSYLGDSVRRNVENVDHDIDLMWQRLDMKYGTVQKLIDCIMSDIKNLPKSNGDMGQVLKVIDLIETAYSDLNCIGATHELQNSTILSMIEKQMPSVMYDE